MDPLGRKIGGGAGIRWGRDQLGQEWMDSIRQENRRRGWDSQPGK